MIKTLQTEYFIEINLVLPIITITRIRFEPTGPSSVHQYIRCTEEGPVGSKRIRVIVIIGKTKYISMKYSVCSVFIIDTLYLILSYTRRYTVEGSRHSVSFVALLYFTYIYIAYEVRRNLRVYVKAYSQ